MTTLKSAILRATRRTKNGFTVGEIFDRVEKQFAQAGLPEPKYSSVRAQVSRMFDSGELVAADFRKDSVSGREATAFVRTDVLETSPDYF